MALGSVPCSCGGENSNCFRCFGSGMLESIYEAALTQELRASGLVVETQVPQAAIYKGVSLGIGYRLDMVINRAVVVEIKSVEHVLPVHHHQLLTYLRLTGHKLGYLINFCSPLLKDGIFRKANGL